MNLTKRIMFEKLFTIFPRDIAIEIVLFEGRVTNAYLQEYVSQVYAATYQKHFGYHHNLRYVTRDGHALHFYAAWADAARSETPDIVKSRTPRGFMRPYGTIVPKARLEKERQRITARLQCYFRHRARPSIMRLRIEV